MNLATIVLEQARLRPKAPAIIASHKGRDRVMTFGGLADASARVAEQLREVGLAPGSAMLLLVTMSPELYASSGEELASSSSPRRWSQRQCGHLQRWAGGFMRSKNLPVKSPAGRAQAGRKSRREPDGKRREEEILVERWEENGAGRKQQNQIGGFTPYSDQRCQSHTRTDN